MPKYPRGDTQQRILEYIKSETQKKGYAPSVREIGEAVGLKSTSTVHGHLERLQKKGLLHREKMKPRTIDVTDESMARASTQSVPVVGRVSAGSPILAEEQVEEYVRLPEVMLGDGENFILNIRGDSMINAGILDGDCVVVHKQSDAHNGDIVVALIDDEATCKRFYKEQGHIRLQAENPAYAPIIERNVIILGKVVSLYRVMGEKFRAL